ncbi:MAG: hypothetical protein WA892_13335 [Ornithinimicrobium sp.]
MSTFGTDTQNDHDAGQTSEHESLPARISLSAFGKVVDVGLDGRGPQHSAAEIVASALQEHPDSEAAIDAVVRHHLKLAAAGGFVTGVGGLFTLPVALPANVFSFYVLAARMVGSVASLRGYDIETEAARTAVVLTLLGADADDLLRKAGVVGGGTMSSIAVNRLPRAAAMVINKGLGFRLATGLGARSLGRLGRAVPLAGGVIGAGLDLYLMKKLADSVRSEFPQR